MKLKEVIALSKLRGKSGVLSPHLRPSRGTNEVNDDTKSQHQECNPAHGKEPRNPVDSL